MQAEGSDAPMVAWYLPAAQLTQVDESDAPTTIENEPMPQLTQLVAPVAGWKVPAEHAEQVAAPWLEYFPAGHVWQIDEVSALVTLEYLPPTHAEQADSPERGW